MKTDKNSPNTHSCTFTGTIQASEEARQALLDMTLDSDEYTVYAQCCNERLRGELIELISIKRLERCPKELFKKIISQIQESLWR